MNWNQISNHLEYLLEKIQNNQCENEIMVIIHTYSGYLLGDRNYIEEVKQKRMTKFGLLYKIKEDLIEQARGNNAVVAVPGPGLAPGPAPAPGHLPVINNNHYIAVPIRVVEDFTRDLCKIVYKE
jgi:hypothetical protein